MKTRLTRRGTFKVATAGACLGSTLVVARQELVQAGGFWATGGRVCGAYYQGARVGNAFVEPDSVTASGLNIYYGNSNQGEIIDAAIWTGGTFYSGVFGNANVYDLSSFGYSSPDCRVYLSPSGITFYNFC